MPISHLELFEPQMRLIMGANPLSVLEIGIGFGQYGLMMRAYLDGRMHQKFDKKDWVVKLHGIEVDKQLSSPVHAWVYDDVMYGDYQEFIKEIKPGTYDLVIATQVIEHVPKTRWTIDNIVRLGKHALISVPLGYQAQHAMPGLSGEEHAAGYLFGDLIECVYKPSYVAMVGANIIGWW